MFERDWIQGCKIDFFVVFGLVGLGLHTWSERASERVWDRYLGFFWDLVYFLWSTEGGGLRSGIGLDPHGVEMACGKRMMGWVHEMDMSVFDAGCWDVRTTRYLQWAVSHALDIDSIARSAISS